MNNNVTCTLCLAGAKAISFNRNVRIHEFPDKKSVICADSKVKPHEWIELGIKVAPGEKLSNVVSRDTRIHHKP